MYPVIIVWTREVRNALGEAAKVLPSETLVVVMVARLLVTKDPIP